MAITPEQFRLDYPEFEDIEIYSSPVLTYWLKLAYLLLNSSRWLTVLDVGAELFVAHHVVLEARAQQEAINSNIPGSQTGPISSKSVDKISVSYDAGSAIEMNAGHWNLTMYGTRFIRLAKMFGAGPVQIGIGKVPSGSGQAWSGPNTNPGFTNFG